MKGGEAPWAGGGCLVRPGTPVEGVYDGEGWGRPGDTPPLPGGGTEARGRNGPEQDQVTTLTHRRQKIPSWKNAAGMLPIRKN